MGYVLRSKSQSKNSFFQDGFGMLMFSAPILFALLPVDLLGSAFDSNMLSSIHETFMMSMRDTFMMGFSNLRETFMM